MGMTDEQIAAGICEVRKHHHRRSVAACGWSRTEGLRRFQLAQIMASYQRNDELPRPV